jgi:hypothetical protein
MSPEARQRVERWLEGRRRARCDGYWERGVGGEGDKSWEVEEEEVENGGVNETVDGKVDEEKVEEKTEQEIWVKEEPGVSSR